MAVHQATGLCTVGTGPPTLANVEQWIAWHLTHCANLPLMVQSGSLLADTWAQPSVDIGEPGIKERRRRLLTGFHDGAVVADYVPFYWTAKSPMMHREVNYGAGQYEGGPDGLALLGLPLTRVIELGLDFCFSDGNASQPRTSFTDSIEELQEMMEMPPLLDWYWKDTEMHADRQRRRQAELLVHKELPLTAIDFVVVHSSTTLSKVKAILSSSAPSAKFVTRPAFFFR